MAETNNSAFPEVFAELAQLRRDAAVLDGRLRAAEAAAAGASGRDPSEQVRVVLTPAGRIEAAEVAPGWRSRLKAAELGNAVLAAHRDAVSRRLETWAAEVGRAKSDTAFGDVDSAESDVGNLPSIGAAAVGLDDAGIDSIRGLWYLLQDASDRLDDLAREGAANSQAVTSGRDPNGHVTATLTGGELSGLHLDQAWSAQASGRELGTAITAAIADGYANIDELAERSLIRQWPFPDLERFTSDPAALLTALGLPVPPTDHNPQR